MNLRQALVRSLPRRTPGARCLVGLCSGELRNDETRLVRRVLRKGLGLAIVGLTLAAAANVHAVSLNPGDILTLDAGVPVYDAGGYQTEVSSGSWFALDMNANWKVSGSKRLP